MAVFFPLANQWINVDRITSVDVETSATNELVLKVWFAGGGVREAKGEDAKKLLEFLKKHQAP